MGFVSTIPMFIFLSKTKGEQGPNLQPSMAIRVKPAHILQAGIQPEGFLVSQSFHLHLGDVNYFLEELFFI